MENNLENQREEIVEQINEKQLHTDINKSVLILNLITGILLAIVGIVGLFFEPLKTAYSVSWAIGFVMIITAFSVVVAAFSAKKASVKNWWVLIIQGIGIGILGGYLITYPLAETVMIVYIYGIVLMVSSLINIFMTREQWVLTILYFILGLGITINPVLFTLGAYIAIFTTFILNGIFSAYLSLKLLLKKH